MSMIVLAGSMQYNIANIATNVNAENCVFRRSILPAISASVASMEVIDGNWIKSRLKGFRGEKARLAAHLGIEPHKLTRILNGDRNVQASEVPRVISFFEREPRAPQRVEVLEEAHPNSLLVPVYDIEVAAGDGMAPDEYEAVASLLAFPPGYLQHITTTSQENLAIISVVGSSMVPTLYHKDIVMVDATKTNIAYDGMFVILHDGLLKVKRLKWGPGKRTIVIMSDNEREHPPEEHPTTEIVVKGRVVWVGKKEP